MAKISKLILFYLFSILLLVPCKKSLGMQIETPIIKAGTANITGSISPNAPNTNNTFVTFYVPHPISGENVQYKAVVDRLGKFAISVDVETDITLVGVSTSLNPDKPIYVKLKSGNVSNIDITYNSNFDIENVDFTPASLTKNDMIGGLTVVSKMIDYRSGRTPKPLYNKSTDDFLAYANEVVSERLQVLNADTLISKDLKVLLAKDFRLFMYVGHVFPYEQQMIGNYHNINGEDGNPEIQKIDKSYFRFLKEFNLNDPQYLYCSTFSEFQKGILQNEILELPVIGDSDVPSWIASVKVILSDLVGFDKGAYYDILAANAYARQLKEEVKPLTAKQKENIIKYWKKGEIGKILFRKNQQVVELAKAKSPAVVNEILSVA
jgi:hypothetical protein